MLRLVKIMYYWYIEVSFLSWIQGTCSTYYSIFTIILFIFFLNKINLNLSLSAFIHYFSIFYFQVVNIFNLFITYGDTFLHSPASYDELYYEIIRMHKVFDNVYAMGNFFFTVLKLIVIIKWIFCQCCYFFFHSYCFFS